MSGRRLLSAKAKYGFNGKLKDNEDYGEGNAYDFGMRIYDPRLGRFMTVDPMGGSFAWNSPYAFAENSPLFGVDLDGGELKKIVDKGKEYIKPLIGKENYQKIQEKTDAAATIALVKYAKHVFPGVDKLNEKAKQEQFKKDADNTVAILLYEFATGTGKETRKFDYNKNAITNKLVEGRVLSEVSDKFTAAIKGITYNEFKDKGEIKIGLSFSPDQTGGLMESVSKHLNSNLAQVFVGGATAKITPAKEDGYVIVDIYNETSRGSLMLHAAENYKRGDDAAGTKDKNLSTIKQHFTFKMKVDKSTFKQDSPPAKETTGK